MGAIGGTTRGNTLGCFFVSDNVFGIRIHLELSSILGSMERNGQLAKSVIILGMARES